MSEPIIKVANLYKDFKLPHQKIGSIKNIFTNIFSIGNQTVEIQHALKDISFDVKKGEFFGIVGRNGSGKSTLLKILAGIYQPSSGEVSVNGRLVPFIELGVGFNGELTGRENVYLNGALMGFSESEIEAKYEDIVNFAGLERFMDQKLKNYSSGMQVRLAFSLAIQAKSEILLVDEVLAVGDADFQRKCFDYFQQLKGTNTTVIFVTHNMSAVREYCDRALLIEESKIVKISDSDTIAKLYSRMFLEETINKPSAVDTSKRWGNNLVMYTSVNLSNSVLSDQNNLILKAKAIAKNDVEGLIFGFSIKNAAKQIILGTNSQIKNKKITKLKKDQEITINWIIPNIFSDGKYTVDIASVQTNGQETDWWEEASSFTVAKKEVHAAYLVSPKIDLEVQF